MSKVRMVKGPATVAVDGACHVLGSDVSDQIVTIRAGKALPFEPRGRCRLRVRLGRSGRMWRADPSAAGTSMWRGIAQKVFSSLAGGKRVTVMLAGDTDTGKSTLSAYLANVALGRGLVPCVVDGDIGQGDLAPPAAIGAAAVPRQVTDLRDISADLFEFVGNISPAGLEGFVASKLGSILERAGPLGDICIINTDGYVRDGGIRYKKMIADELQPDAIVYLGNDPRLFDAFKVGPWEVLRARPSNQTFKSRSERIGRRLDQFLRFVGNGLAVAELPQTRFAYMDRRISLSELELENMEGMFVGLGGNDAVTGFGVITSITADKIYVQTDVAAFSRIYLSSVRLDQDKILDLELYI